MDTIERLKHLVEVNCLALVDDDHHVAVSVVEGQENVVFEVYCNAGDEGLIIGRQGHNIEAIRTLVCAGFRGQRVRSSVEVMNSRRDRGA